MRGATGAPADADARPGAGFVDECCPCWLESVEAPSLGAGRGDSHFGESLNAREVEILGLLAGGATIRRSR